VVHAAVVEFLKDERIDRRQIPRCSTTTLLS
jgi:hypothetical protein